ncbi:rCG52781, isoform CRA_b [Rattus norvegicus]|uniref:RCG52781, isoform CRA_b n=1 Tax=Rattus norvegicus TaxID=10116 RepID=A6IR52_RAT|nr:testis-specific expressed protein 55 isoform X1 [Rattus norvegicus]EDM11206.1 rCG52781, isoform CRA_b [Rattus norvegicus]|eukprot:XP_006248440.1 PREDICTED: uncharacterized protein C3orf30 homolog isoform X1 [Rattus norvegicus]
MDEPPLEVPDESLNHENADQTPDNQKTNTEEAGQVLHRGSEHAGVGSSEPTGDKVSGQGANAGYRQATRRTSEEAEQRSSQPTEQRLPGLVERRASQPAERRLSERRTSQPPSHPLPSLSEGKTSERIDGQVSLPSGGRSSEQADPGSSEQDDLSSTDETYYASGKSQRQTDYWFEDPSNPHRLSEEIERDITQVRRTIENHSGYRSYYKTLARTENQSLTDIHDIREAGQRVQPCTFEDNETDIPSKVSTADETESTTTVQAYTPYDTEIMTDTQSSREKLPSITNKVYYPSSPEKIRTTEFTADITTELEQRRSSQKYSQSYRGRFPLIVFDDPYQVALRYMEKHSVLQIFQQITEKLVYEMPDDPLRFMLDQVQDMIRHRDEREEDMIRHTDEREDI